MLKKIDPTQTEAWEKLREHFKEMKSVQMKDLFEKDKERFSKFSLTFKDILVDFSKNIITAKTLKLLLELSKEINIKKAVEQMFSGEKINETENRSVLHTALRNRSNKPVFVDGIDVMPKINAVLQKIENFSDKITTGQWLGFAGKAITDIVNIGIGGSNLGPLMVTEALKPYKKININTHYVSNVDGTHIVETLKYLNPETTLFLIASKTFTTQETMTNAYTARKWFLNSAQNEDFIKQHFIAISTNEEDVIQQSRQNNRGGILGDIIVGIFGGIICTLIGIIGGIFLSIIGIFFGIFDGIIGIIFCVAGWIIIRRPDRDDFNADYF